MAYNRKQRLNDNIKAIETAFILDREQRTPTARERLLLERYCGFGGLKCILNPARELADAVHWAKSDLELFAPTVELHRLIRENSKNESEYKQLMDSLKQSVLTAFYTPSAVTEALTDVLKEHQIIPEKVLEPSAGIGAFVDSVLDNNPKADIMAFEKDLLTGKILHHLHPEQKVRIEGFEKIEKPFNDYFDLANFNMNTERKRGGRIPKLNPKSHHVMLRFDDDEWMKFLVMYEQTDVKAKAVFAKARIFGEPFKVLREDKTLVEYYTKLSSFHSQYRMIGNNYNQVVKELRCHFSEKKAMALLYKLENCTRELVSLTREIVELTRKFEERWSQR